MSRLSRERVAAWLFAICAGCGGAERRVEGANAPPAEAAQSAADEPTATEPTTSSPPGAGEPDAGETSEGAQGSAEASPRERARRRLALPLPRLGEPAASSCVTHLYQEGQDEDTGQAEWWELGDTLDRFDAHGRRVLHRWNSNQAALSGEITFSYRADGTPSRTQIVDFESISGDEPRRIPPLVVTVAQEGTELVTTSRRVGVVGRVERVLLDDSGRVLRRSIADAWEDQGDPFVRPTELPEPTVRECTYDAEGRVVAVTGRRFVYEGDVLVAIEHTLPNVTFTEWLFALDRGFVVMDDDGDLDHYVGACAAIVFEPCAPTWSPRLGAPEGPAVTFGVRP